MIEGVKIVPIVRHTDERGFFNEIVRFDNLGIDPKQESHAYRVAGVSNGWHIHRYHIETFYVIRGIMRLSLKDCRNGWPITVSYPYDNITEMAVVFGSSQTPLEYAEFILSEYDPKAIVVPAGVAHGYTVLKECDIIYTATATYETSRRDEGRIKWDYWQDHDWTRGIEIK